MPDITQINLTSGPFERYRILEYEDPRVLPQLARLNFFVGPNNSGKSRFLREIAKIKKLHFKPTIELSQIANAYRQYKDAINDLLPGNREVSGIRTGANELPALDFIHEADPYLGKSQDYLKRVLSQDGNVSYTENVNPHSIIPVAKREAEKALNTTSPIVENLPAEFVFRRIYIPTLRGLRGFENGDCYEQRTKSDYFKDVDHVKIFTGLSLYDEVRDLLLGNLGDRAAVAMFQNFLSQSFFDNSPVALIPRKDSDVLYVKIGDEEELPIHELGDGIQMIIILTFPLFRYSSEPSLVFIEEPDLFLHPGLQRLLIRRLSEFSNHQYFIATHSNHFLDLSLEMDDISIYHFEKELGDEPTEKKARFTIEPVSSHDQRTLKLLGTRNSSVFLANCTIWVEGITDRRYLSHYLNLYQAELSKTKEAAMLFKEDLHFSFVEYSGSNITHWSFLDTNEDNIVVERLCSKLFLITDRDSIDDTTKQARHAKLKEALGDRYYCLQAREIENLISKTVLERVLREYEKQTPDLLPFTESDYAAEPLGKFLQEKAFRKKHRGGNYSHSGAISDKLTFCERTIKHSVSFEDLSDEAKELTIKLLGFIADSQ